MQHIERALNLLKESTGNAKITEDGDLFLPDKNLGVRVVVERVDEGENGAMAVLYFWLTHPSFEQPLFETAAAFGENAENAVGNAVKSFYAGIFSAVNDYLEGQRDFVYNTDFFGEAKEWDVVASDLVLVGQHDKTESYWDYIKDKLKDHMGDKSLYYVKIFTAKQADGDTTSECRINDVASTELSKLIVDYANSWKIEHFHSQKQFFFISQQTPSKYPYKKEQIDKFVEDAVKVFEQCENDERYQALTADITAITNDPGLAVELKSFLPEICAEYHFDDFNYAEYITVYRGEEGTEERFKVYKDQFTPYNWIKTRLADGFKNGEFSETAYKNMVSMSATFGVYLQVKEKGSDMNNVTVSTGMYAPANYKVR